MLINNEKPVVKRGFAIHKSLPYTAREVYQSIEDMTGELSGSVSSLWADGWTILDPEGVRIEDWTRNKDDYRIEYLYFDEDGLVEIEEEGTVE